MKFRVTFTASHVSGFVGFWVSAPKLQAALDKIEAWAVEENGDDALMYEDVSAWTYTDAAEVTAVGSDHAQYICLG